MNLSAAIVLASLGLGVAAASTHLILSDGDAAPSHEVEAAAPDRIDDVLGRLSALADELDAVRARVDGLDVGGGDARVSQDMIDAAVRRALAGRALAEASPAPAEEDAGAEATGEGEEPLDDLLAEFLGGDEITQTEVWRRIVDAGLAEEALALLEERAEAAPNDPEAQLDLGKGYLARISEVGNSPLAGQYATAADRAFDRALAVDPRHWEARMHKAVALSFWPPVFGKQNEAIRQFQTLVEQQAGVAPRPHHAQTHLLLGNMYQQIGETEKALSAWRQGTELFPDDEDLARQLQLATQDD